MHDVNLYKLNKVSITHHMLLATEGSKAAFAGIISGTSLYNNPCLADVQSIIMRMNVLE